MNPIVISLEQELNPFEQSFFNNNDKPTLPPLALKTSSGTPIHSSTVMEPSKNTDISNEHLMYTSNECSPAITNSIKSNSKLSSNRHRHQQDDKKLTTKKRKSQASKYMDDDEKRKNFLERNRQAALKCRQRKKQWLNNLQAKVEYLTNDNEQLQIQSNLMRDELIQLRHMLWNHRDCPLNKHATIKLLNHPLPPGQPIMMPPPLLTPSTDLINSNINNNHNNNHHHHHQHQHQHHHPIVASESSLSSIPSSPLSSSSTSTNNIQTASTIIPPHHPQDYMVAAAAIQYPSAPAALL